METEIWSKSGLKMRLKDSKYKGGKKKKKRER
jgi:hypothetical protein